MSAIAGLWRFDGKPDVASDCSRMLASQQIYGPHDSRQWCEEPLALGRRLFRTLPEDAYDKQPLTSPDGGLVLVADVRLDNRDTLIADMRASPEAFRKASDAAVLLACLDHWGEAAVNRLAGDFAFALWDTRGEALLLARDFLGQRPLHFHRNRNFFAFASMPKGLHALPEIPYGPDEQVMSEFLVLLPQSGPGSFFNGIERVEAGHIMRVSRTGCSSRRYWEPRRHAGARLTEGESIEGLRHHLDLATKARMRTPQGSGIATQLSGGFDSGAVTATAARLAASAGEKIFAFTGVPREGYAGAVPRGRFGDEGPLAAATAALYPNIEHVLVRRNAPSPLEDLDRMFFLFDRPMLNLCNWGWVAGINQAARERGLRVMLTGQMGNMTISYAGLERLGEMLRTQAFDELWHEARLLVAKRYMTWRGVAAQTFGPFVPAVLWQALQRAFGGRALKPESYSALSAERLAALDLGRLAAERDTDLSYRPRHDGFAARVWMLERVDLGNYNKGCLAGWQVDQRDPTADKRLVEFCLALPGRRFLADGVPRALGQAALADRLPRAVLSERRKGYQGADWHEGLAAARDEVGIELERLAGCAAAAKTLDLPRLKSLLAAMPNVGWERAEIVETYRLALLRGIAAGHFLRKAMGAN